MRRNTKRIIARMDEYLARMAFHPDYADEMAVRDEDEDDYVDTRTMIDRISLEDEYTLSCHGGKYIMVLAILGLAATFGLDLVSSLWLFRLADYCLNNRITFPALVRLITKAAHEAGGDYIKGYNHAMDCIFRIADKAERYKYAKTAALAVMLSSCFEPVEGYAVSLVCEEINRMGEEGSITILGLLNLVDQYCLVDDAHRRDVNQKAAEAVWSRSTRN